MNRGRVAAGRGATPGHAPSAASTVFQVGSRWPAAPPCPSLVHRLRQYCPPFLSLRSGPSLLALAPSASSPLHTHLGPGPCVSLNSPSPARMPQHLIALKFKLVLSLYLTHLCWLPVVYTVQNP